MRDVEIRRRRRLLWVSVVIVAVFLVLTGSDGMDFVRARGTETKMERLAEALRDERPQVVNDEVLDRLIEARPSIGGRDDSWGTPLIVRSHGPGHYTVTSLGCDRISEEASGVEASCERSSDATLLVRDGRLSWERGFIEEE